MRKLLLSMVAFVVASCAVGQVIFEDDFESYNTGEYLALQSDDWTTWSDAPGTGEDAYISEDFSLSPVKSVLIEGISDIVYKMGDRDNGKYKIAFNIYVEAGYAGYYNIQHYDAVGTEWALEVYFNTDGSGIVHAGGQNAASFSFTHDQWIMVETIVNLDDDEGEFWLDGGQIHTWQWSLTSQGDPGINQLGAIDLFAGAQTGESPKYYFDDFVFEAMANTVYADDFESYNTGEYLALQSDDWTTWSNAPGTAEDALITEDQAHSAVKSVIVEGTSDLFLPAPDITSGKYQINLWFFVPTGFGGYYNFQHYSSPGTEWAMECYFATDGSGLLHAGGQNAATFSYNKDEWFQMKTTIDLDNDLAQLYKGDEMIHEWQWSLTSEGEPGANQLGGMNCYAGAPTGETAKYYFDDIEVIELVPAMGEPSILLTPNSLAQSLEIGNTVDEVVSVSNEGSDVLDYAVTVIYPGVVTKEVVLGKPATHRNPVTYNLSAVQSIGEHPSPVGNKAEVLLNYDGENSSSIGLNSAGDWRVAAMYPAAMVAPYVGMSLESVDIFVNDPATSYKLQIYDMGSITLPGPGALLYEQDITLMPYAWNTVFLDDPMMITGKDLWVGYWLDQPEGAHIPGTDEGPADPNGDWISTGLGWSHLGSNPDLNYNWNIRARLQGDAMPNWLSVDVTSGSLDPDGTQDITATFDATGLDGGMTYNAQILFQSNDPENESAYVDVTLAVMNGLLDNEKIGVMIYPNPASEMVSIKSNIGIQRVEVINAVGQVVLNQSVTGEFVQINTAVFKRGIYFIRIDTEGGSSVQKLMVH